MMLRRRFVRDLLICGVACSAAPLWLQAVQHPIRVTFVAGTNRERAWTSLVEEGVKFGIHEARRTAGLLGRDVTLHPMRDESGEPDFTVSAAPGRVTVRPRGRMPCLFDIRVRTERRAAALARWTSGDACSGCPDGARRAGSVRILEWHPSLERFGASELNERFRRATGSEMTAPGWLGWVAVKASVEAALRSEAPLDCEALARARFDGHKGRPLTFDPSTRELVQPVYVITTTGGRERVAGEINPWQPSAAPASDRGSR